MTKHNGFTLIELTITLTIFALLTMLGAPPLVRVFQSHTISSTVNTFTADMRYARSEAIRLNGSVILCRSDSPERTAPECSNGSSRTGWVSGWIVFQDMDASGDGGNRDVNDPVLRIQTAITSLDSIVDGANSDNKFRFTATGRLLSSTSPAEMSLLFGGANFPEDIQRLVCINPAGRARVAGNGIAQC